MSDFRQKVVYGVCENIKFPCFFRLIFSVENQYKMQVLENNQINLIEVDIDLIKDDILKIATDTYLDVSKPNYGIALNEKDVFCGTKEELERKLELKIKTLNPYFQVEYYSFMQDYLNLRTAYYQLSKYEKASKRTKEWSIAEYKKINSVILLILQELRKNSMSFQYVCPSSNQSTFFFKNRKRKKM